MAPERSQLETNVICPEKLIARLKTIVVSKDHRERKKKKKRRRRLFTSPDTFASLIKAVETAPENVQLGRVQGACPAPSRKQV